MALKSKNINWLSLLGALFFMLWIGFSSAWAASDYLLGPGDVIRISVFQNPELTLDTRVTDGGEISYPLIGTIEVGGLNTVEAENRIAEQLRMGGFLLDPQVSILLLQVQGNQVSVLGYVLRPGKYPIEQSTLRVSDMLALGGGVLPEGGDMVKVTGIRDGLPFQQTIDISRVLMGEKPDDDIVVMANDVIYVPKGPIFYIHGEVQRPGAMRLERGMTLRQAIAQAGGLTPKGTYRGLRVRRRNNAGHTETLKLDMEAIILNEDVIEVKESWF